MAPALAVSVSVCAGLARRLVKTELKELGGTVFLVLTHVSDPTQHVDALLLPLCRIVHGLGALQPLEQQSILPVHALHVQPAVSIVGLCVVPPQVTVSLRGERYLLHALEQLLVFTVNDDIPVCPSGHPVSLPVGEPQTCVPRTFHHLLSLAIPHPLQLQPAQVEGRLDLLNFGLQDVMQAFLHAAHEGGRGTTGQTRTEAGAAHARDDALPACDDAVHAWVCPPKPIHCVALLVPSWNLPHATTAPAQAGVVGAPATAAAAAVGCRVRAYQSINAAARVRTRGAVF